MRSASLFANHAMSWPTVKNIPGKRLLVLLGIEKAILIGAIRIPAPIHVVHNHAVDAASAELTGQEGAGD